MRDLLIRYSKEEDIVGLEDESEETGESVEREGLRRDRERESSGIVGGSLRDTRHSVIRCVEY